MLSHFHATDKNRPPVALANKGEVKPINRTMRIFKNFIMDQAGFSAAYFISFILIIAFFYLSGEYKGEILYPLVITLFIYAFYMTAKWFGYYRFSSSLDKCIDNEAFEPDASTAEQRETARILEGIRKRYNGELSGVNSEERRWRHFISQWVHNMKTPVSVIDLIIQRISGEGPADKRIEDIGTENAKILNGLEQILNIMRLEDFARDYVPETIDLAAAVAKVINEKKSQFIYNNVFPRYRHEEGPVFVLSDAKWNQFMLEQIVSNAIKYSGSLETARNVWFAIRREEGRAILDIRDEGVGIPDYDMPRIFEPFFTGENGRRFRNSTGIGLYICRSIADRLGHGISIRSESGKGTTVSITYLSKM